MNDTGRFDYTYVYHEGQQVVQMDHQGNKEFIFTDHLGSSSAVTDFTGAVIEQTTYEPFGAIASGGQKTRYDYEGKELDVRTGEYDFHFRTYDPDLKMFTKPDSLLPNVYDPQQLNRYMFERGNPYGNVDPDGHNAKYVGTLILNIALRLLPSTLRNKIVEKITGDSPSASTFLGELYESEDERLEREMREARQERFLEEMKKNPAYSVIHITDVPHYKSSYYEFTKVESNKITQQGDKGQSASKKRSRLDVIIEKNKAKSWERKDKEASKLPQWMKKVYERNKKANKKH